MPIVSQRDLAHQAGVSVSAVSLALRNHPKVSAALRGRVQRLARELGYRMDPRVSQLMGHLRTARARRAPSKLAVLVPDLTPAELSLHGALRETIRGARELADEAGFAIDVFYLTEPGMTTHRMRDILVARGIQGIFVTPFVHGASTLNFDFSDFASATTGYNVASPALNRSCPNHLQMFDQMFSWMRARRYARPGLVLTACHTAIEHRLIASAFLYFQQELAPAQRLAPFTLDRNSDFELVRWLGEHCPDVVLGSRAVYERMRRLGVHDPRFDFVDLDLAASRNPSELDCHRRVGRECIKLILSQLMLNQTGVPQHPKTVLVDSVWQPGEAVIVRNLPHRLSKRWPTQGRAATGAALRQFG